MGFDVTNYKSFTNLQIQGNCSVRFSERKRKDLPSGQAGSDAVKNGKDLKINYFININV